LLLLRADFHTLLDCGLLAIEPQRPLGGRGGVDPEVTVREAARPGAAASKAG
jgi:hypothetical protein